MFKIFMRDGGEGYKSGNFVFNFSNGWAVSVAMGDGIYSSGNFEEGFARVEVAVIDPDGEFVGSDGGVAGWQDISDVMFILNEVSQYPASALVDVA